MPARKSTDDDAMPQEMADAAMADSEEEWEEVRVGLGKEWEFTNDKPLVGIYLALERVELPNDPERDDATVHQFLLTDESGEIVFLWGSHNLDAALTEIGAGDKVRITYLGRESFTSEDGPRQIKRYRVQKAVSKSAR